MLSFDSLWLKIPMCAVRSYRPDSFVPNLLTASRTGKALNERQLILKDVCRPIGVSSVTIHNECDLIVKCSAKILKDSYLDGICINNFDRIVESLLPHIDIDIDMFYQYAEVLNCDATQNIDVSKIGTTARNVFNLLSTLNSDKRIRIDRYDTKTNNGIVYTGGQKSFKNRMIVYDKHIEMSLKRNNDFIQQLNNPTKFIESTKNVLRFELNNCQKSIIKKRFDIKDNYFSSLLNSRQSVLSDYLINVTQKSYDKLLILQQLTENEFGELYTPFQIKTYLYYFDALNFDENAIKKQLQIDNNWTYDNFRFHWHRKKNHISLLFWFLKSQSNDIKVHQISEIDIIIKELEEQVLKGLAA